MLLQYLKTFCRVVDEGSFTRAAESLNLSQPTVTKQVKRLEEELQAELLARGRRHLTLTPAGDLVYLHARRILNTLKDCRAALDALATPGAGDLSIGAVFTLTIFLLPRLLEGFKEEHPLVTIYVRSGTNKGILDLVLHNEVDAGLTTVPITHDQIITRPLYEDKVVLVCSADSEWAERGSVTPAELSQIPMIGYDRSSQFRAFVDMHFEAAGVTPNIVMEFDSHDAVKAMVQLRLGVAMAPHTAVREDLNSGRLCALRIESFPEISRLTSLIVRRDRRRTPALADFIRHVEERFSG